MKRWRRWGFRLGLAAVAAAALYAGRGPLLPWAARWLDVSETPRPADYAMALGGDAPLRPFVVAALLRCGLAAEVLVSRVGESEAAVLPSDHELCRRVYSAAGIAPERITLLGHGSRTTYDEALALREFLQTRRETRVLLVTSPYHTRRARWIFRQVLGPQAAGLCWVAAPSEAFQAENWWRSARGMQFIPPENLRFLYYVWRYSPTARWGLVAGVMLLIGLWLRRRIRNTVRPGSLPKAG